MSKSTAAKRTIAIILTITAITAAAVASPWTQALSLFGLAPAEPETQVSEAMAFLPPDTRTVCNTGTPDFATVALAVADANAAVPAGGRTYLVCAGHTETAPPTGIVLTAAGSDASNPVSFVKDGAGTNPTINAGVGTATPGSAAPDGIFSIRGADYITIDGFTFTDGNAANPATMEFGIGLFKAAAGNGANNNTIQNCTINMQRINNATGSSPMVDGSVGILVINSTATAATTALTPTNGGTLVTNGTNSANKFYTNTINGGNYGITLSGFAASSGVGPTPTATTFLGDLGNDIGGTVTGTGNSILNFGGGAATNPAAGIRANNQWSVNISYNTVNNNNGSGVNHATTLRGIYAQAGTSASATINNNTVTLQGGATTSAVTAIDNSIGSTAASNTISISNNTVNAAYTTATTGVFTGIQNGATAATVNINGNTITGTAANSLAGTGTHVMIETGSPTTVTTNSNNINNLSRNGASGSWRGIKTTSPTNWTANSNTITNLSWTLTTSTGSISPIYSFSSAVNVTANSNTITNLSTPTTGTIIGIQEFGSSGLKTIQNNTINNFSTSVGGAGGATFTGISESTGSTNDISGNTIFALNSTGTTGGTGGTIVGITVSSGTTNNIYKNKIYDLSTTSTGGSVNGITQSGGTTNNIYNNLIGDLRATALNATNSLNGLNLSGGTTNNVSFNTIQLNATSTGANFGSSGINASTSPTLAMRNNIVVNTSTVAGTGLTVAYRRTSTTLTSYASASNNNAFYAGVPSATNLIFNDGTNSDQTIALYKTRVASRDSASFSENPPFLSTTGSSANFLHINTAVATQLESGGSTVSGITDDFDGNTRNVSTPDVGADEFAGIGLDLSGPSISYTTLANTASTGDRVLTTTITDASGVPTSGVGLPIIYYKKNSDPYASTQCSFISGSTYDCSIVAAAVGGVAAADVITYYVAAQDTAGTPNVSVNPSAGASGLSANPPAAATPPTTPNTYTIVAGFTGNKTVCASGCNYTTLTGTSGIFNAINTGVVTGNVTVEINGDLTTGEDGSVALNPITEEPAASNFTVKIYPTGVARAITSTTAPAGGFIRLNGADRVTIDGSIGGTGTDRSLTITEANTGTTSAVVWLQSNGTDGATNNTIKNLNIVGNSNTTTLIGIGMGATGTSSVSTSSLGTNNNTNTIQNNNISKTQYGIYSQGASAAAKNTGNIISQNLMNTASPNNIQLGGILVGFESNITISGNTVSNLTTTSDIFGISVGLGNSFTSTTTVGNEVTNANVSKNLVGSVVSTSTTGFTAIGIGIGAQPSGSTTIVSNNMVSGVLSFATPSDFISGIHIGGGAGTTNIYFNSVSMTGSKSSGSTGGTSPSYALSVAGTTPVVDIRNNILVNSQTSSNATPGKSIAIGLAFTSILGNYTNLTSNNNDLFVSGSQGTLTKVGSLTQGSGTEITTLAGWTTETGRDGGSVSGDPKFLSATDLHISAVLATPVESAGTPIAGITTDFDGDTRNVTTPDIGADEGTYIAPVTNDVQATSFIDPTNGGSKLANTPFAPQASFTNNGTAAQTSVPVRYRICTDGTCTTELYNDLGSIASIASGASSTVTFSSVAGGLSAGVYTIKAKAELVGDTVTGNDEITGTLNVLSPLSGAYTVGSGGNYTSLTNNGGVFEAINSLGATSNLTINITSDLSGETGTHSLNQISGGYTVLIKPSGGVRTITSTTSAQGLITLNGADNVTIDGSLSGGTDRSLNLVGLNTAGTSNWVVGLISGGAGLGPVNNTIKNTNIQNAARHETSSTLLNFCIYAGAGSTSSSDIDNLTIENNSIQRCSVGIQAFGFTGGTMDNLVIKDNTLGGTATADYLGRYGIYSGYTSNALITGNTVRNVVMSISGIASANNATGIGLATNFANSSVTRNNITNIAYTGTGGYGGKGIDVATTSATSNLTIANNFISDIRGDGWNSLTGDSIVGLRIGATTGGVNIWNNSINLGSGTFAGNSSGTLSAAFFAASGASALDVRNNIFATNLDNTAVATDKTYAVATTATTNSLLSAINYNDYFVVPVSGTTGGFVGLLNSVDRADLAAWQTASGQDANSISLLPQFTSSTDLHLQALSPMADIGATIASVPNDYDGDLRPQGAGYDIGADEIAVTNTAPTITAATGVSRIQSDAASNSTIATVTDTESGNGAVTVTVTTANPSNGVTISNIVNTNGTVTADIAAGCGSSDATFTLQASDGSLTNTATFNVQVFPNTSPVITYSTSSVATGGSTTVNPATGPSDNGSIASIVLQNAGTYTGTISVNNTTGAVSISNAGPYGSHTITVRATDNCGAFQDATFTLNVTDSIEPDTSITGSPSDPSNNTTPQFTFSGSDSGGSGLASFECQVDVGGFAACSSPFTTPTLSGGSHTFQVRAKDTAGNTDSTPASYTWTVDITPPVTTINSQPANPTNSTSATFTFSSSNLAGVPAYTYQCKLDAGAFASCTSGVNYTGLADGSHTFEVKATDTAGNVETTPASYTWTVDTVAPDTSITANPTNPSNSASASFSFTGSDTGGSGVAGFECQLDGGAYSSCTTPKNYSGLADGSHTFSVRAIDVASNIDASPASYTWTVDTIPPVTTINSQPANPTNSDSATFTFSSTNVAASVPYTYQCKLDAGAFAPCSSGVNYTGLADGSHTFQVKATDIAGNVETTPASYTWTVDATAPNTFILTNPTDPSNSSSAAFTFSGTDATSGVAGFECQLDGGGFASCTTPKNYTGLADGSHTFEVRALDVAGNTDASPATFTWVIDTAVPTTATNLSAPETYTEDTSLDLTDIVVSDADSANVTATLTLSNASAGSLTTATSGVVTSTFSAGVWTASGPIANVNTLLAGVSFVPAANFNANFTIATSATDGVTTPATGSKVMTGVAVNDPPTATNLSAAESYTEDTTLNLTDIVVSDIDSSSVTVTLTLSNASAGSLTTATSGVVTSTFSAGVWTASGPVANVNTLLAGVSFVPAANFNANFTIATSVSDGVAAAVTGSKVMTGVAVNDPPTATNLSAAESYTEDTTLNLIDIVVADVDSSVTATLTLSNPSAGSLTTATSGVVTSTFSAGVWTASGPVANVNTLLAGVSFVPAANFNANFTIATSVSDGVAAAVTGSKAMTGVAVNDPPVAVDDDRTTQQDVALVVSGASLVSNDLDPDGPSLTVTAVSNAINGSVSLSAGTITFTPTPGYAGAASFDYTVSDGSLSDVGVVNVTVTPVDGTAPVITYTPIPNGSTNPALTVTATDAVGVTGVTVFWSTNGGSFTSAGCSLSGGTAQNGTWTCQITGMTNPSSVAYYVTAQDAAANTSTVPAGGATAPNLFTLGAATVPAGTYGNVSLGDGVVLGGDMTVTGSLTLNGIVSTGASKISAACGVPVTGAGPSSYVIGNFERFFCSTGAFTFPTGTAPNGPIAGGGELGTVAEYSPVTVNITGGTVGSSLTVSATDLVLPGVAPTTAVSRYWTLTESGSLTADLTFNYLNEDVNGVETGYQVFKRSGSVTTPMGGTINAALNQATVTSISDFSGWGIGTSLAPTAATVSLEGRILTASGAGIRNATVVIEGSNLPQPKVAATGSFGYYRFDGLDAGQTYVVTVNSKRFTFAVPSRVLNLTDNVQGFDFVAIPQD